MCVLRRVLQPLEPNCHEIPDAELPDSLKKNMVPPPSHHPPTATRCLCAVALPDSLKKKHGSVVVANCLACFQFISLSLFINS